MSNRCLASGRQTVTHTGPSLYDVDALAERAAQWRAEAGRVRQKPMRALCLGQADMYEQRIRASLSTPIFREQDPSKP
jgi:hypothetical protein